MQAAVLEYRRIFHQRLWRTLTDKRFALALGLSLLIWVVWLWIFKPLPEQPRRGQEAAQTQQKKTDQPASVPQAAGAGSVSVAQVVPEQTAEDELEIPVTTDRYQVKLSNRGATISAFKYLYNGREIDLVASKKNLDKYGFSASSGIDFSIYQTENEFQNGASLDKVLWSHEKISGNSVKFSAKVRTFQGSPIVYERVYTFHKDKFYFELQQTVRNAGRAPVQLPNNYLIATTGDFLGPDMDFANSYNRVESAYYLDDDFDRGSQGGGLFSSEQDNKRVNGQVKWVGMMSRYFLMLMVPRVLPARASYTKAARSTGTVPACILRQRRSSRGRPWRRPSRSTWARRTRKSSWPWTRSSGTPPTSMPSSSPSGTSSSGA